MRSLRMSPPGRASASTQTTSCPARPRYQEAASPEIPPPMTYELGDITVHTHLTIHGAGANLLDRPRWAYIVITQPSDVCWNGSPCPNFDYTTMKPWEPFGDERFPVIS